MYVPWAPAIEMHLPLLIKPYNNIVVCIVVLCVVMVIRCCYISGRNGTIHCGPKSVKWRQ